MSDDGIASDALPLSYMARGHDRNRTCDGRSIEGTVVFATGENQHPKYLFERFAPVIPATFRHPVYSQIKLG
jgi:hypothetical protein